MQRPIQNSVLKRLPGVSRLLAGRPLSTLIRRLGRELVTDLVREDLDGLRARIREGQLAGEAVRAEATSTAVARRVARAAAELLAPRPRQVINATGVVIHTNLGRSLLSDEAADCVAAAARGYVDLEYDLAEGGRGSRFSHLAPLMNRLFPESGFVVVNNNAAAIMLCLRALARNKDVLVSRGELVEIGGSFRVPDILSASGARLREVGTTNRTRLSDYQSAISKKSGLLLKVHASNFAIVGFTQSVAVGSLSKLARRAGLPLVVDWGSGDLVDLEPLGIHDEIPIRRVLADGADLVTFSGDKLLGGPQAGFVVGDPDLIARLRKDPLARVCRLDRLMVAALHQTLSSYVRGRAFEEVPTLRMLAETPEKIGRRASALMRTVARATGRKQLLAVIDGVSRPGGGSSPSGERPTRLLAVAHPAGDAAPFARRLREAEPALIGRVHEGRLLLDLRTVRPAEDPIVARHLIAAIEAEV